MTGDQLTGKPLLIVGPTSLVDHVKKMVLGSQSPLSFGAIHEAENYDAALQLVNSEPQFGAIIVAVEGFAPATAMMLAELSNKRNGPLIVLCDEPQSQKELREHGFSFILPLNDLQPRALFDMLFAAWSNFQLHRTNQRLQSENQSVVQRFQDVAEHFADWLWEIDKAGKLIFSSSRKRPTQGADKGTSFASCFLPDEKTRIEDDFATLLKEPKPFRDREYWSFDAYGTRMCWNVSGVPVYDATGELTGFRGIARDISAQKSSADQLYHLANNDSLTGLYNRGRFYDELSRAARQAARSGHGGALVVVDIDRFNYVNESYGHEYGDKLLVHAAQIIKDNMRAVDFIARTGSNEFALILPDVSLRDLEYRLSALRETISKRPLQMEKGTITFSASIGAVRFPEHGRTADELLSRIGYAVQQAKVKGRNRAEILTEAIADEENGGRRLEWLDFVSRCLDNPDERMILHYQPIVPLAEGSTDEFYEVLVRMVDEEGELVSPIKFIETAEEFGVIGKIDQLVTQRVVKLLAQWHANGRKAALSVNISCRTFDDDEALQNMLDAVRKSAIPPGSLVLEITETSLIRDIENMRRVIKNFKEHGVMFALDDCGVGYSSLNYIRQLDLDYIKIDGTFIRNMHRNEQDRAFVRALHNVAEEMKIRTVAEMVENEETLVHLKEIGLDYAQGYYFAVPGPDVPDKDKLN